MINSIYYQLLILGLAVLFANCTNTTKTTISGNIDYLGDTEIFIEKTPLHYKYSEKERIKLDVINGSFETNLEVDDSEIAWLVIQDLRYPLYIEQDLKLEIVINRAMFPLGVTIQGPTESVNESYQSYLTELGDLNSQIDQEMDKFKVGESNIAQELSEKKLNIAEKHLKNTLFNDLYLKTIGEHYVIQLRSIEYSDRHFSNYDAENERESLLNNAVENDFFSLESLTAQRAGIRDFTHYYARTFGIYDRIKDEYQLELAEYDIKRIAYHELNQARLEVIHRITDPKAKAYAELFLLAERLGEIPFEEAEPTYFSYLENYSEFTEYVVFADYFYNEIKSISPGEEAIPFTLPDIDGNLHTMDDYKGKFVLLDFWAGWCQPCLEEFPIMNEIYSSYSREELEIVGISNEVDSLVWVQDLERFNNPWVQLYSGDGFDEKTFKAYKGGGIPFYILVDPEGKIARYNDMRPSFNFTQVFDSLLVEYKQQNSSTE